jgi:hypothetical protein
MSSWSLMASSLGWSLRNVSNRISAQPTLLEHQKPSQEYILKILLAVCVLMLTIMFIYKQHVDPKKLMSKLGVSLKKVARAVQEVERKAFHIAGLLVPLIQALLLRNGFTNDDCTRICIVITVVGISCDFSRIYVPVIQRNWPLRSILRKHEYTHLTGGSYFSLGCTISIGARQSLARDPVLSHDRPRFSCHGDTYACSFSQRSRRHP